MSRKVYNLVAAIVTGVIGIGAAVVANNFVVEEK